MNLQVAIEVSLMVLPPLIGHGHGGVDTAAQADVVERVDDLNTDSVRARFTWVLPWGR